MARVTSADASPDAFLTAVSVLDSLIRSGMRHVVVAPGSRSAPLTYALAAADEAGVLDVHVRIDERSAAFTALGMAASSGSPVGVVTTSGTAVGELMPAVMEANHSEVPLAVISADRPPRLRGTGANQTTWQADLYGVHVRAAADLTAYPEDVAGQQTAAFTECLAALTGRDPRDWGSAAARPIGPVQINVSFDDPLTPDPRMRQTLRAWADTLRDLEVAPAPKIVDRSAAVALEPAGAGAPATRAVVVAGDGAGLIARRFAEANGAPLLAEPSSGARAGSHAIGAYQLILGGGLAREIETVILFGRPTLSRPVQQLLARPDVASVLYLPRPIAWANPDRRSERVVTSLREARDVVGRCEPSWLQRWREADAAVSAGLGRVIARDEETHGVPSGPGVARTVAEASGQDGVTLVAGSSNLIRDLDIAPAPKPGDGEYEVLANRGLAGIDGTIATASGVSLARGKPVRALVGDLTFLHDAGSLLIGPTERMPDLQIVVFNDTGGGIFSTLEHGHVARDDDWADPVERFFGTPHAVTIESLVTAHGHDFRRVRDLGELREALGEPIRGIGVIEVLGTRDGLSEDRERWKDLAREADA